MAGSRGIKNFPCFLCHSFGQGVERKDRDMVRERLVVGVQQLAFMGD
jgi:hypothetical protein